jgi:hypothetical protein
LLFGKNYVGNSSPKTGNGPYISWAKSLLLNHGQATLTVWACLLVAKKRMFTMSQGFCEDQMSSNSILSAAKCYSH